MRAVAAALLLAGCVAEPGEHALPPADYALFAEKVQPILAARCANPTCHGSPGRPLEVYAVHLHRRDPARVHRDEPLTEAEQRHNFERARAFVLGAEGPADCLLLTKPLAPAAGGVAHGGGVQFADTAERDYATLRWWVARALVEADP